MYSPYLYARQSELLALRSVLTEARDLSHLIPAIEPVLISTRDIRLCIEAFVDANRPLIVVTNPRQHQFNDNLQAQRQYLRALNTLADHDAILPGYVVAATTTREDVDSFLRQYQGRRTALFYNSPNLTPQQLRGIAANRDVSFHIVLNERISALQLAILPTTKLIDTRDHFNKQLRNADYNGSEFFTDRHKLVPDRLLGIGDYTIVGRSLDIGGGKPGAVAIHATYAEPSAGDIWIEHFVSDDVDRDVGDTASKFLQAARKLARQVRNRPREFGTDTALTNYLQHAKDGTFPGLGKNKQYQIHHHICRMLASTK